MIKKYFLIFFLICVFNGFSLPTFASTHDTQLAKNEKIAKKNIEEAAVIPKNEYILSSQQRKKVEFIQDAWFNGFNRTDMTSEAVADKYFSHNLKFYAGDTGKIIDFKALIGRMKALRHDFKSVYFIYSNFTFSSGGTSVSENHIVVATKQNGDVLIAKTSNIYRFDAHGKISEIYNVEQELKGGAKQDVHYGYETK